MLLEKSTVIQFEKMHCFSKNGSFVTVFRITCHLTSLSKINKTQVAHLQSFKRNGYYFIKKRDVLNDYQKSCSQEESKTNSTEWNPS
jgi:hypothetical protein